MSVRRVKCVVVGDGASGKNCFLEVVCNGTFPPYVPMISEVYSHSVELSDGQLVEIGFWYTAGQDDYDRLRPLSYPDTDVVLLCFPCDYHPSFENVADKWLPEVKHFCQESPLLLVGMKSDLRTDIPASNHVKRSEAIRFAKNIGAVGYYECSAKLQSGLDEVVKSLVNAALHTRRTTVWPWKRGNIEVKASGPHAPELPKAPLINIPSSTLQPEWQKMINNDYLSDVQFHYKSDYCYYGHKVMLCATSELFRRVFEVGTDLKPEKGLSQCNSWNKKRLKAITRQSVNNGAISAFKNIYDKENVTVITVNDEQVTRLAFERCLSFLYTGCADVKDDSDLEDTVTAAELLNLPELVMVCQINKVTHPTESTVMNQHSSKMMKQLFLNKSLYSDVTFVVDGKKIPSHRCVLTTRCELMSAMFSGQFSESSTAEVKIPGTDVDTFMAFLQYLYTDHAPIEGDPMALLVLADQYCMDRLRALCELHISNIVLTFTEDTIAKSDMDFIGLLFDAQLYNADQLSGFLLHFISSNYLAFESTEQFQRLTGDNLSYVQEHRWPPLSYIKSMEEWREKFGKKSSGSSVKNTTSRNCVVM
ncbi:rho-related protein racA-like isoform X2 [Dysidea avara]|uniref:rho-related protein racA-like isoform X2 n=1 Tax=Dysidea avara TaxID=196820 RepID=UPI003323BD4F